MDFRNIMRGLLLVGVAMLPLTGAAARPLPQEIALTAEAAPANSIWLDTLDLKEMVQGWDSPKAGKSVDGQPLTLAGVVYPHGVGTHAFSHYEVNLKGSALRFTAMVGIDDEKKSSAGSVVFLVTVDGKVKFDSGVLKAGTEPKRVDVDLTGAKRLVLDVTDADDGIDSDHADWAGALFVLRPGTTAKPAPAVTKVEPPRLVIPKPDPKPAIHGARVVGGTPGRSFLYRIAATGDGPLTFAAKGLPEGLSLEAATGIISGSLKTDGETNVAITVKGPKGSARRTLTIIAGQDKLARTPPMGWNSWNVWAGAIDGEKVKAAADSMIKSGLAAHGFQYVNIDDCWQGKRNAEGVLSPNEKFPDMKGMGDYVHSLGLKFGIYSSPGPRTCAGFEGSYQHTLEDAKTYGEWGVDYLKYDWCSYGEIEHGNSLEAYQKPYKLMHESLEQSGRDIVYSLCQYGMGNVWEWGMDVGGNCWRTTGDINDSWHSLYDIFTSQAGHEKKIGPGHWNDPDMLVVGKVGWGNPHPSGLKPNEQILHISMWCMLASPLLIGCDMNELDPFTLALLTNDEALDINQDPLGQQAHRVLKADNQEIWARPLFDGTTAVALVNTGMDSAKIEVKWSDLNLSGEQPIRDLWLHKSAGSSASSYSVAVPAHGCVLLKIGKPTTK